MYQSLIYKEEDNVAWVTLNRPEALNPIDRNLLEELEQVIINVRDRSEVRVVVITGSGRAFSAGGDIRLLERIVTSKTFIRDNTQLATRVIVGIATLEKPVIAAVNGPAAGGGCSLAMTCDIVVASELAEFSLPFFRLGLAPDMGPHFFLPRLVGLSRAKWLVFMGDSLSANEAKEVGLVSQIVSHAELYPTVTQIAARLAKGSGQTMGMSKQLLNRSLNMDLSAVMKEEGYMQSLCALYDDASEGVRAFIEKRKPQF